PASRGRTVVGDGGSRGADAERDRSVLGRGNALGRGAPHAGRGEEQSEQHSGGGASSHTGAGNMASRAGSGGGSRRRYAYPVVLGNALPSPLRTGQPCQIFVPCSRMDSPASTPSSGRWD